MVGAMLVDGWGNVGTMYVYAVDVGATLAQAKEQSRHSNVAPTIVAAVGPTLRLRLAYGWQTVTVLAGK